MGLSGVSFTYGITVDPTNLICAVIDRLISVILCECISHQAKANAKTPRYTSVSRRPGGIYLSRQSVKWQVALSRRGRRELFSVNDVHTMQILQMPIVKSKIQKIESQRSILVFCAPSLYSISNLVTQD
jgi:hypothetical protein